MGHRKNDGFTLVELLAVMMILTIVAMIVRPDFSGALAGMRARAAIRTMVTDIRYARQMAVSESRTYYFLTDCNNNYYRIKASSYPEPEVVKQVFLDESIRLKGIKDSSTEGSVLEFHFRSTGAPSSGISISLEDYRGKDYEITILPATGRVRVYH